MWEEKRGSPFDLKYSSSASSIPSNQGNSFYGEKSVRTWLEILRTDLGTVVAVEDNRHAVVFGHQSSVLGPGDGPQDGRLLSGVLDSLPSQEGGATVGELDDDG